jgi:hypothetical protein
VSSTGCRVGRRTDGRSRPDVVDVGQQFVARPGIPGPYRPVGPDRQLPADGQLGQQRAGQADLDESVAPGGDMSLVVHGHQ